MMHVTTLGIDVAKQVFHIYGADARGHEVFRKRLARSAFKPFLATLPPCLIGIEAWGGAHYWARELEQCGYTVRLINPRFVKPFVKSNRNDAHEAEAICEAVSRPTRRFVPIKTIAQQDLQALPRVRQRLVRQRTGLVNQMRGLLAEYGIVWPRSIGHVRRELPVLLETAEHGLTPLGYSLFQELHAEFVQLEERIEALEQKLRQLFGQHGVCQRLAQVEGIGRLTATALVAAVGDPALFRNGRELAAWLGLVPKQQSSGGREVLLGISKRGNRYLRTLLIHGARTTVYRAASKTDARSRWITAVKQRRGSHSASP